MSYRFPSVIIEDSKILKNSLDYSKMLVNSEGLYSTLLPIHADQEINMFNENIYRNITDDESFSVLDTTANVGSGSLTIANYYKDATIVSLEINPDTFNIMCTNIRALGIKNVTPICVDCFNYIEKLSTNKTTVKNKFTVVYCDPPWGGPKKYNRDILYTDLYLEHDGKQVSVVELMRLVFDIQLSNNFVLKTPPGFAIGSILDQINACFGITKIATKCIPVRNKRGDMDYYLYIFSVDVTEATNGDITSSNLGISTKNTHSETSSIAIREKKKSFSSKFCIYQNSHNFLSLIRKFLVKQFRTAPRYIIDGAINYIIKTTSGDITDADILMELASGLYKYKNIPKPVSTSVATGRAMARINDIKQHIAPYIGCGQYLDIGCSEGSLTHPIGTFLGVDPKNIHGCDLAPATDVGRGFVYTQASVENLPYEDDQFQFVSLIMSLHHFPDPKKALREIRRVLVPGGILLIREHNCTTDEFSTF